MIYLFPNDMLTEFQLNMQLDFLFHSPVIWKYYYVQFSIALLLGGFVPTQGR